MIRLVKDQEEERDKMLATGIIPPDITYEPLTNLSASSVKVKHNLRSQYTFLWCVKCTIVALNLWAPQEVNGYFSWVRYNTHPLLGLVKKT